MPALPAPSCQSTSVHYAALCCCFLFQVLKIADSGDGQLSIMYTAAQPTAPPQAAAKGDVPHIDGPPLPAMLLVDALVLAAGGFAANKQMLQVRPTNLFMCGGLLAGHAFIGLTGR
jgi:hypothetical protein